MKSALLLSAAVTVLLLSPAAQAADGKPQTIGYVLTEKQWAVYQTADGKAECPQGLNKAPLEQFKALLSGTEDKKPLLTESQLKLETAGWYPDTLDDALPYLEAQGPIAIGMNLDGKVGPAGFVTAEGEEGIDNQLYRAIGCISAFRAPTGRYYAHSAVRQREARRGRMLMELTGVDDLVNDSDVTVTFYHGKDRLFTDASGLKVVAGGSQRVDVSWTGDQYVYRVQGKIVDGLLTTTPTDIAFHPDIGHNFKQHIRAMRLRLKLTAEDAEGLMAGYADVEDFYHSIIGPSSYFRQSSYLTLSSLYKALRRLADGYPDPKTGANTAISEAQIVTFKQVFITHPPRDALSGPRDPATGELRGKK